MLWLITPKTHYHKVHLTIIKFILWLPETKLQWYSCDFFCISCHHIYHQNICSLQLAIWWYCKYFTTRHILVLGMSCPQPVTRRVSNCMPGPHTLCSALHCTTLQCIAKLHCSVLQYTPNTALHCVAKVNCSVLHWTYAATLQDSSTHHILHVLHIAMQGKIALFVTVHCCVNLKLCAYSRTSHCTALMLYYTPFCTELQHSEVLHCTAGHGDTMKECIKALHPTEFLWKSSSFFRFRDAAIWNFSLC